VLNHRFRSLSSLVAAATIATTIGLAPVSAFAAPIVVGPPPTTLPDLQAAYTGDTSAAASQLFTFTVKVTSVGAATKVGQQVTFGGGLPAGFLIQSIVPPAGITCEYDNKFQVAIETPSPLFVCVASRPFLPNSSVSVSLQAQAPARRDQYHMDVFVDVPNNAIREHNENNNFGRGAFQVT
jgi:hypothetical protein